MKNFNFQLFFVFTFLLILISACGDMGKMETSTVLFGGTSALCAGGPLKTEGGIYVIGKNLNQNESISFSMSNCSSLVTKNLSFGDWRFVAYSWAQDATGQKLKGITRCAQTFTNISSATTSVNIDLSKSNCANSETRYDQATFKFTEANGYICDSLTSTPNAVPVLADCKNGATNSANSYRITLLGHHTIVDDPTLEKLLAPEQSLSSSCILGNNASALMPLSLPMNNFIPYQLEVYKTSQSCAGAPDATFYSQVDPSGAQIGNGNYIINDGVGSFFAVAGNGSFGGTGGGQNGPGMNTFSMNYKDGTGGKYSTNFLSIVLNAVHDFPNNITSCSVVNSCLTTTFDSASPGCNVALSDTFDVTFKGSISVNSGVATWSLPTPRTNFSYGSNPSNKTEISCTDTNGNTFSVYEWIKYQTGILTNFYSLTPALSLNAGQQKALNPIVAGSNSTASKTFSVPSTTTSGKTPLGSGHLVNSTSGMFTCGSGGAAGTSDFFIVTVISSIAGAPTTTIGVRCNY